MVIAKFTCLVSHQHGDFHGGFDNCFPVPPWAVGLHLILSNPFFGFLNAWRGSQLWSSGGNELSTHENELMTVYISLTILTVCYECDVMYGLFLFYSLDSIFHLSGRDCPTRSKAEDGEREP